MVVASVIITLVAVSGLIALLYRETRGPGEILREFARRVDDGDCPGSYELLAESVRTGLSEDRWCERLAVIDEGIDSGFELERAILMGDQATVYISGVSMDRWLLERFGERSWRVIGPPQGFGA
jgi:hypothetical protein